MKSKTKKIQFTKERWRMWLATVPPGKRFDYLSNENCAVAQFLKQSFYVESANLGGVYYNVNRAREKVIPSWARLILNNLRDRFTGRQLIDQTRDVIGL